MSQHSCRVIRIAEILPHPNADKLSIVPIPGTSWRCVTLTGNFKVGDLAIYIEPDMEVPVTHPLFSWLAKDPGQAMHRLKPVRLRGEMSFGIIVPYDDQPIYTSDSIAPIDPVGVDLSRALGVRRYEPTIQMAGADALQAPWPYAPNFDVESLANFPNVLVPGENVVVTEKIHGTCAKYMWQDGVFYMGSKSRWLDPDAKHVWHWAASLSAEPFTDMDGDPARFEWGIEAWCKAHEGMILFGEVYGPVQSLKYGLKNPEFRAFAAWEAPDRWFMPLDTRQFNVKTVPLVYAGAFEMARITPLIETDSGVPGAPAGHMMEGVVITAWPFRRDPQIGRVALKVISNRYWLEKST